LSNNVRIRAGALAQARPRLLAGVLCGQRHGGCVPWQARPTAALGEARALLSLAGPRRAIMSFVVAEQRGMRALRVEASSGWCIGRLPGRITQATMPPGSGAVNNRSAVA